MILNLLINLHNTLHNDFKNGQEEVFKPLNNVISTLENISSIDNSSAEIITTLIK